MLYLKSTGIALTLTVVKNMSGLIYHNHDKRNWL